MLRVPHFLTKNKHVQAIDKLHRTIRQKKKPQVYHAFLSHYKAYTLDT